MHVFRSEYGHGDFVRIVVDPSREVGMVTSVTFHGDGVTLGIQWGNGEVSNHFPVALEPTEKPNFDESESEEDDE